MNRATIKEKKKMYLISAKKSLDEARCYLSEHAEEWDSRHQELWLTMINAAECELTKAEAMEDLLYV